MNAIMPGAALRRQREAATAPNAVRDYIQSFAPMHTGNLALFIKSVTAMGRQYVPQALQFGQTSAKD